MMKLKKQIILNIVLMTLPLVISSIALIWLPDQVPAHYGANGQVDKWGSKYEILILPVITIIFGLIMMVVAKFSSADESSGKNNQKITLATAIWVDVLFNAMNLYFLYASFKQITDLNNVAINNVSIDIYDLIFVIFGIGFIIIGNVMPKVRLNSLVGLRTPWSMKNEDTWRKSQRFGGIAAIITGLIMTIGCIFFFDGMGALIFSMTLILSMAVVDTIYSYVISKKY